MQAPNHSFAEFWAVGVHSVNTLAPSVFASPFLNCGTTRLPFVRDLSFSRCAEGENRSLLKQANICVSMSKSISVVALTLFLGLPALSQSPSGADPFTLAATPTAQSAQVPSEAAVSPAVRMMADFKDSDVKFDVNELVDILRDRRHEGWVLAAYPDPRTGQPLTGAGFSLDLAEREHPQTDPLNPHQFLEPSSADLWRAAGFDPGRLDDILKVFYERKRMWSKRMWRRQLYSLPAQISNEDATQLVRVGAIQAIYNARAYCRNFDELTGPGPSQRRGRRRLRWIRRRSPWTQTRRRLLGTRRRSIGRACRSL